MNLTYEKDNKERVPFEHYLEEYKTKDPFEISRRTGFPYLEEERCFQVSFFGKEYRISFPEYEIQCLEEGYSPLLSQTAARILVIRFLIEGCQAVTTGKFLTYREVPWGEVYFRQFQGRCMMRLAYGYGSRLEAFSEKMEKLGAVLVPAADKGYQFEVFPGFYVQFLLWEGDEEFLPSSQILFSDNFPAAFHAEDLVVVCDIGITTLKAI